MRRRAGKEGGREEGGEEGKEQICIRTRVLAVT